MILFLRSRVELNVLKQQNLRHQLKNIKSIMRPIVGTIFLLFGGFTANGVSAQASALTCNVGNYDIPATTDQIDMSGSAVRLKYGINRNFGGVGVNLRLINLAYPTQEVSVLEGRSAAGAGWQWTQNTVTYGNDRILTNQASGNGGAYGQWGWSNTVSGSCTTSNCYINAGNWAPLYRDSLNGAAQSPCPVAPGNSFAFDEGRFDIAAQPVSVPGNGNAITFARAYTARSTWPSDQYWKHTRATDAHYFRRKTARDGDLRVFIKGRALNPATGIWEDWRVGPIRLYDKWLPAALNDLNGIPRGDEQPVSTPFKGTWSTFEKPNQVVDHVVLVWNILGVDTGIAIRVFSDGASIRMLENVYTGPSPDRICYLTPVDECGSIDVITYHAPNYNVTYAPGSTRTTQSNYHVGTKAQLQALGYWLY